MRAKRGWIIFFASAIAFGALMESRELFSQPLIRALVSALGFVLLGLALRALNRRPPGDEGK